MSESDLTIKADELKGQGNACFKAKKWKEALEWYTKAIEMGGEKTATYYSNRATVHYKLESYGSAELDATTAVEGGFKKAYYRRGQTRILLGKLSLAIKDFKKALKFFPKSKETKIALKETQKALKKRKFASAINHDEPPISERIPVNQWTVPESYKGPKLELDDSLDFTMTKELVMELLEYFKSEKNLCTKYAASILLKALKVFKKVPTIVDLNLPKVTVCGDTHGQFYDLLHIFEIAGYPSEDNPFVFNGDFVDRGSFSCEVILTLLCFKILYPKHFHLTRGNHETVAMTSMYGFQGEANKKYSSEIYELFMEVFNWLPLGIIINKEALVVHGGIPKDPGVKIEDFRKIDRARQPPNTGYFCDLVWADPQPEPGFGVSPRGVSHRFGPDISKRFLDDNNLKYLVRSHEMKEGGYEIAHDGRVITVFSAPNYCDTMGNKGAVIIFREGKDLEFKTFEAQPHPNIPAMAYSNMRFLR